MSEPASATRVQLVAAFAAVYLIWGSTYLAIRYAIETLPGFTMAGVRFLIAGLALYAWARMRGAVAPTRRQWRTATIAGGLLFVGGNGLVVWAEQWVPSGLAALIVGTEPLWVAILMLAWPGRSPRPTLMTFGAVAIGFAGAALLAAPDALASPAYGAGVVALLIAPLSWAAGSLYLRDADLPSSAALATAVQMIAGGALLLIIGPLLGEWRSFDPGAVSLVSLLALAYLIVFGALVAFRAYTFLVRTTAPTLVATYAFVNPVVAVLLGWLIAGEPVGPRVLIAALLIVGSVVLIVLEPGNGMRKKPRTVEEEGAPKPAPRPAVPPCPDGDLGRCA